VFILSLLGFHPALSDVFARHLEDLREQGSEPQVPLLAHFAKLSCGARLGRSNLPAFILGGHPIASIDMLTYNQVKAIQQPLD